MDGGGRSSVPAAAALAQRTRTRLFAAAATAGATAAARSLARSAQMRQPRARLRGASCTSLWSGCRRRRWGGPAWGRVRRLVAARCLCWLLHPVPPRHLLEPHSVSRLDSSSGPAGPLPFSRTGDSDGRPAAPVGALTPSDSSREDRALSPVASQQDLRLSDLRWVCAAVSPRSTAIKTAPPRFGVDNPATPAAAVSRHAPLCAVVARAAFFPRSNKIEVIPANDVILSMALGAGTFGGRRRRPAASRCA